MREHNLGHSHPCPVTGTDNSGGTSVDITLQVTDTVFRRIVGLVTNYQIDGFVLKVLRGIQDQTRVASFTLHAGILLPITVDLGNYAAIEDTLWINVTGTKAAGVVVQLTLLLSTTEP